MVYHVADQNASTVEQNFYPQKHPHDHKKSDGAHQKRGLF